MAKDKLPKAQSGTNVPKPNLTKPMLDEGFMEERFGGYRTPVGRSDTRNFDIQGRSFSSPKPTSDAWQDLLREVKSTPSGKNVGPVTRTGDQYIGSDRYDYFNPDPDWDNEDAAAQGQGWGSKMVNGVMKGVSLTGTTLLQNTVGLVNGIFQAVSDGRLASFYDNEFNRSLDEANKYLEDALPNYYTKAERDADWYSPTYWATGNFLWDGVVKNMGFAAGTYLSAGVYTNALRSLPLASKLFSTGKAAETLAATEAGLAGGKGTAGILGKLKGLSDSFLKTAKGYNSLSRGQQIVVSGLSTTGEAGFEGLHNMNEFRQKLISEYERKEGVVPTGDDLMKINRAAEQSANAALFTNIVLLTASNYVQLPKIFGSTYNGEKALLNGLGRKTKDITFDEAGKAIRVPVSKLQRVINTIRKPYVFSYSEALEESSQFAVGVATNDYYDKQYNGEPTDWIDSISKGITQGMFSNEGAKNALIGGLSGSIMQNVLPGITSRITGKETSNQRINRQTEEAIEAFNESNLPDAIKQMKFELSDFTKETKASVNRGVVLQQEREQALKNGEVFESKNLEADAIINYLTPRIKYGRFDLVKEEIEKYKAIANTNFTQLQEDGIALQTDTKEAFLERLDRFEETANASYSLYQSLNIRYGSEFSKDKNGEPIKTKDGKGVLKYPPSVMNKMLYAALKTEDFDQRILQLTTALSASGINVNAVLESVIDGKYEAYNEAVSQIKNLDELQEKKDKLGVYLDDIADATAQRQVFIKTYKDIQDNPSKYIAEYQATEEEDDVPSTETVSVKTKQGERNIEIGTVYFAGKGVDYSKDPIDKKIPMSRFVVEGVTEDNKIQVKNLDTGKVSKITASEFENLNVGKESTLKSNVDANFFYQHRNEIFTYNFGKNFGKKRTGRIEYKNGKLYFVYLDPKGKVTSKLIKREDLEPQGDFKYAKLQKVGSVENRSQEDSRVAFMTSKEIKEMDANLKQTREDRLSLIAQLGEQAKEELNNITEKLAKQSEQLAKVKEDLKNIQKMKETGEKIKLNFSKATKSFTRSLNRLTKMQAEIEAEIESLEALKDENEFNIEYFESFSQDIKVSPEDNQQFIKELKDQQKLLKDNGVSLGDALKEAKKLSNVTKKAIKSTVKMFRNILKNTYVVDEDYSQYLSELLDQAATGENIQETWPLLKQEMANFALTADLSKDATVNESLLLKALDDVNQLTEDLNAMRAEYKARKVIIDRFQSSMDEYLANKKATEEQVEENNKKTNSLINTGNTSQQTNSESKEFEPESKKATEIITRATTFGTEGTPDQIRADKFGMNFHKMPEDKRKSMRGVYVTLVTEAQLGMSGLIQRMLSTPGDKKRSKETFENYKDSTIALLIVNDKGEVVDENGEVIPTGENRLDKAIYQVYPDKRITSGDGFRKNTPKNIKNSLIEQYKNWRAKVLNQETIGEFHTIGASFGNAEYEKDENDKNIYGVTSVEDAGLIEAVDLEKSKLIYVPKVGESVEKGTTKYENVPGVAFLNLPEAFVKLKNRLLTNKEANSVFESILQLSKNLENTNEGISSDSSKRILNFLKGVVYWGIPKDQNGQLKDVGFNSVFFKKDPQTGLAKLVISNNENEFMFDSKSLEMNKTEIIQSLENIYNNIDASPSRLGDLNTPFEEITSVSTDGKIKSTIWPNYQTYILSGKGRENFELPAHVTMRPLDNEDDVNRKGFYFFTTDNIDDFKMPKASSTLSIPKGTNAILDNETPNPFPTAVGDIQYTGTEDLNHENYNEKITLIPSDTLEELKEEKNVSDQQIKAIIYNSLLDDLARINREKAQSTKPSEKSSENKQKIINRLFGKTESPAPTKEQSSENKKKEEIINRLFTKADKKSEDKNGKPVDESVKNPIKNIKSIPRNREALRVALNNKGNVFKKENWKKVESWLNKNFPNVPVYRVENIIKATNGRQAWGMFKDGAIYVYKNAEAGTAYHEVFEAVWKMFTTADEQTNIINEFKERKGTFVDRPTRKTVKFSEATPEQIKEQLAEEFRDFVQKKEGVKGLGARIAQLFRNLKKFIETVFLGEKSETFTDELFNRIGNGYYKKHLPYARELSMAKEGIIDIEDAFATSDSEFRLVNISETQADDVVNEMMYLTLLEMINSEDGVFEITAEKINEILPTLKDGVFETLDNYIAIVTNDGFEEEASDLLVLKQAIQDESLSIEDIYKEKMMSFNITFDEDVENINKEEVSNRGFNTDATKVDNFKKSSTALRLLMSTLPMLNKEVYNNTGEVQEVISTIGGAKLLPTGQVYSTLMDKLYDSRNIDEMISRLRDIAINDINYASLYKRLTNTSIRQEGITFDNINKISDARLITALWTTVNKQKPTSKVVYVLEDGSVTVGDAELSGVTNQIKNKYYNSIITKLKSSKGFFKLSSGEYSPNTSELNKYSLTDDTSRLSFLKRLGVDFNKKELNRLTNNEKKRFNTAVSGIKNTFIKSKGITSFSKRSLNIGGDLTNLAEIKNRLTNPNVSSTFYNVSGEKIQSYIGVNAASDLHNTLSKVKNINELKGTQYEYLLTDVFSKGSSILNRMFASDGSRKEGSESLFSTVYAGGIVNSQKGTSKSPSSLSFKERLTLELNLNLNGIYLNLVPADAGIEWALDMGNLVSSKDLDLNNGGIGLQQVINTFKGYFISEVELAKDDRTIPTVKGRENTDLRFFKGILGETLHDKIVSSIVGEDALSSEAVYSANEEKIVNALIKYIQNKTSNYISYLEKYNVIEENLDDNGQPLGTFKVNDVNLPNNMSSNEVIREMTANTVNYMISNIEMHKLLYSDPYQYKGDELKRTKSFLSPRQSLINSSAEMNVVLNNVWNEGFDKDDIGHTDFTKDYMSTASHKDIIGVSDLPNYKEFKETDGGGIIGYKAYRNFRIRVNQWNLDEEKQYRYDVAWEKRDKNLKLSSKEKEILKKGNPKVQSAYTSLKPIVSGAKLGYTYNNVVLDKYALYPLSYRVMKEINPESNAVKLYNKMQNENIDYIVFESGRKVGAESSHTTYNEDASFNDVEYAAVVDVPFAIMSLQSDVPSKEKASVTRGSQITKLITLDYLNNGIPEDFESKAKLNERYTKWINLSEEEKIKESKLYKEIKKNEELLRALTEEGYVTILNRLGIEDNGDGTYTISDKSKATKTLRDEMFKRETDNNVTSSLNAFLEDKSLIEATPAYQQVRNILYSIVDKQIVRPKISGSMKVQIPSSFFESARPEFNKDLNGYTSDVLNFYEDKDGKRVMEVMVGRWFNSNMSDKDLLKYLNDTKEGQKILSGLAFRIPTQSQNSIDAFKIKQFLPSEFGDNVVVPAAIVEKVGSDFDIDKLSMYLKNVFYENGELKLIPFYGIGKQAKDKFAEMFDSGKLFNKEQRNQLKDLEQIKDYELSGVFNTVEGKRFNALFEILGVSKDEDALFTLVADLKELGIRDVMINKIYKQSLENEYIQSSENLVTNSLNFTRLTTPNSSTQLEKISKTIVRKLREGDAFDYTNVDNMLDKRFMSRLRHSFLVGKRGVGIAALNQTFGSLYQRIPMFINPKSMKNLSKEDRKYIRDGKIKFKTYNKIDIPGVGRVATLSKPTDASGQLISNISSQFVDGYVDIAKGPWIMEMGATPNTVSTFMFLNKIGVPIDTVAYFMNQPIIRDYLNKVETSGYSWLYIDDFIDEIKNSEKYKVTKGTTTTFENIPDRTTLLETLGKKSFNASEKAQQQFMLDEFLKYSKMAGQLFLVTQGSNYDTSRINDPNLILQKNLQYSKAKNTIFSAIETTDGKQEVVSAVDAILNSSFIGSVKDSLNQSRNALGEIITSDKQESNVRRILTKILTPYAENLRPNEFLKVARKATQDLFDYAVNISKDYSQLLQPYLLDKDGVALQVLDFVNQVKADESHPLNDNLIIRMLEPSPSTKVGNVPNNIKLTNTDNKTYDKNQIIYAFRELRDYLKGGDSKIYQKIIDIAVIQSGTSPSPISFTSLIPYEDFEKVYNESLSALDNIPNLDSFETLGLFQRNNWSNNSVTPYKRASWIKEKTGMWKYNPSMAYISDRITDLIDSKKIPPLMTQAVGTRATNLDYMVYSWEKNMSKYNKDKLRRRGDFSFINKALFKKVIKPNGDPLIHRYRDKVTGVMKEYFVYKAVNALGDSFRAKEFRSTVGKSIIDNGFMEIDKEVSDTTVMNVWYGREQEFTEEELEASESTQQTSGVEEENNWKDEDNNDTCVPF